MLSPRQFLVIPLLAATVGIMAASQASAQNVTAALDAIEVVESGDFVDAKFRITVTNGESAVASNVVVAFADGAEVNVGDVAAEGSAASGVQTRAIDVSAIPTRNVPVPVTVKFFLDGVSVELAQILTVRRGAPAAEGQGQ